MTNLKNEFSILQELENESSRKGKEEIIKLNSFNQTFLKILEYSSNYKFKYNINKLPNKTDTISGDVFAELDYLKNQTGAKNHEIQNLVNMCQNEETIEVVKRIVNKDLRCGVGTKTIKKFIDIPEFGVALCISDFDKFKAKLKTNQIFISPKLDGVRCIAIVYQDNSVRYFSRNGKEYFNFNKFDSILIEKSELLNQKLNIQYPIEFDGEILSKKGFQSTTSQIFRKSNVDTDDFSYNIFDLIVDGTLEERLNILKELNFDQEEIIVIDHDLIEIDDVVLKQVEYESIGYEGVVIKTKDSIYEKKRMNNWCKLKTMNTIDADVIDLEYGTGKYENSLGALVCEYNGIQFNVGSGFNDEERLFLLENPPKMIELKYQEMTEDGVPRFPVYIKTREDKE